MRPGKPRVPAPAPAERPRPRGMIAGIAAVLVVAVLVLAWWRSRTAVDPTALGLSPGQGGPAAPATGPAWFREIAAARGLDFHQFSAPAGAHHVWFPEIFCGGVALFDADADGDLDVFATQGGDLARPGDSAYADQLYANDGAGHFTNVTTIAGVGDTSYGMGCAVGDVDRDGDLDLFVANCGPDTLYRNEGGGRFTDVTALAGVGHPGWSSSAAFVDYDQDSDLDLFVVQYILWSPETERSCYADAGRRDYCSPLVYAAPARSLLYDNDGRGVFTEVSVARGLNTAFGNGLGVVCADFDADGWIDIYVANDGTPNQLWQNQRGQGFVDVGPRRGAAVNREGKAEAGMGVLAFDVENDGDLDIFLTHLASEHNTLYVQRGEFEDDSAASGLGWPSLPYTGFGVLYADFDHDGHGDLLVANGRVSLGLRPPEADDLFAESNLLMRGLGGGKFAEVSPPGGTQPALVRTSRAAASGDLDGDGDIDVVVIERDGPISLLENQIAAAGRWVMFTVIDERGHEAIGAMVGLRAGGREQWRLVHRASSYQSSIDPRVHFGLAAGEATLDVRVRWLDGTLESFGTLPAAQIHTLRRGSGR